MSWPQFVIVSMVDWPNLAKSAKSATALQTASISKLWLVGHVFQFRFPIF
jgi:hypothetical protein